MHPPENIKEGTQTLKEAVRDYATARAELIAIESKEAGKIIGDKAAKAIAAMILLLLAWGCFLVGLILLGVRLSDRLPESLQRIGGGALVAIFLAIIHVIPAAILLRSAKRKMNQPLFQYTKSELKKDQEWLNEKTR